MGVWVPDGAGGYLVLSEPWPAMLRTLWGRLRAPWDDDADLERGDVPGWVLITVMTLTLGFGLFKIAGPELNSMLRSALNSVQ